MGLMLQENMKSGIEVRINGNISKTDRMLDSNMNMQEMAGDGQLYIIFQVVKKADQDGKYIKVAIINGYNWHPDDLTWDEEMGVVEPLSVAGEKQKHKPSSLY